MDFNTFVVGGFAAVFMVSFLVFIHEAGHFLVAKFFGVGVPVFSLGMGHRVWGFQYKGTDYRISALPVGGYVQLAGADPFGELDLSQRVDPDEDFMKKPVWVRLAVMFAGPLMNLLLPIVLFTGVFLWGVPQQAPTVGRVHYGSEAYSLGIRSGDKVLSVEGAPVVLWSDLLGVLGDRVGVDTRMTLSREGGEDYTVLISGDALRAVAPSVVDMDEVGLGWQRQGTRVGVAHPSSPVGQAGLQTGDLIREVGGADVESWSDLMAALVLPAPGGHVSEITRVTRLDDGGVETEELTVTLPSLSAPTSWTALPGDPFADSAGLVPIELHIGSVTEDLPAEAAGFQLDDRVFAVNGVPARDFRHVVRLVGSSVDVDEINADSEPSPIGVTLVRDGELIQTRITPKMHRELIGTNVYYRPIIGYSAYTAAVWGEIFTKDYTLPGAVSQAVYESRRVLASTLDAFGKLFVGEIKPQESLGGPIEIVRQAAEGARQGLFSYVGRACAISISLGIVNLLPVPVLDGGQILFYLIEGIRGRPLSLVLRERLQMAGVLALVALMLMVFVFDINRLFGG